MSDYLSILVQANESLNNQRGEKPDAVSLVDSLLKAEKNAKKQNTIYTFEQLLGTWRLCFITGTKKVRNRGGIMLGSGRYLPDWINIKIVYSAETETTGRVQNSVQLGMVHLSLTGPVKFLSPKNILVFDFTRMKLKVFGVKLYDDFIRNGKNREDKFHQEKVNQQAFFAYFLIRDNIIAARGRGGGLAVWSKV